MYKIIIKLVIQYFSNACGKTLYSALESLFEDKTYDWGEPAPSLGRGTKSRKAAKISEFQGFRSQKSSQSARIVLKLCTLVELMSTVERCIF